MENASKALIIAGSILISILIVGLGVIIYNNVSGIASGTGLDQQAISAHNSPFEGYFGTNQSGANVRALISSISSNNRAAAANQDDVGNKIYMQLDNADITGASTIKNGRTYTVALPDNENYSDDEKFGDAYWTNGYIKSIVITTNKT